MSDETWHSPVECAQHIAFPGSVDPGSYPPVIGEKLRFSQPVFTNSLGQVVKRQLDIAITSVKVSDRPLNLEGQSRALLKLLIIPNRSISAGVGSSGLFSQTSGQVWMITLFLALAEASCMTRFLRT